MDLTDEHWQVLVPLLPPLRVRRDGRGRPWRDPRDAVLLALARDLAERGS